MKNLNLIKRLWTDSHEKQKVRGMQKYCILLLLLFTCVTHAYAATIPAGTTIYVDVSNFSASYNSGYYLSVTASANSSYSMTKSNTSGAASYKPKTDSPWYTLAQVSGNIYSATIASQSTVGKITIWSKNESSYDQVWEVNVATATYDGTNNLLTISSGYITHSDRRACCFNSTWSTYDPCAAGYAPSEVVSGTNVMFYVRSYSGSQLCLTKGSNTPKIDIDYAGTDGFAYANITKTNRNSYYYVSNNRGGWGGVANNGIKTANGGELFVANGSVSTTAAKTAATTASVAGETLSISTTTSATQGVYSSKQLYIQYYIDNTFAGVTYSGNTAICNSIKAGGATARTSTFNVSGLTNGSHTLKTILTDGIVYYIADEDNFNVAHTYSISFNKNGGDTEASGSWAITYGGSTISGAGTLPTKTGYNINGYYKEAGCTNKIAETNGSLVSGTVDGYVSSGKWARASNTTLYVGWTAKNYSVTLDKNDGDSDGSVTATYDSGSLTSFSAASRAGYSCDGYFTAADGGTLIINANGTLAAGTVAGWLSSGNWVKDAANITLYAHWTEDITYYRLKFGARSGETSYGTVAAEDGSGNPLTSNTDYLSGTSVTVTATATDDDYKFDSWYNAWTSGSSVSTDNPLTFTLSAATDRYAHFIQKTTSITLNKNNGSGGTAGPVTATHGNTTLSTSPLVNPSRSGYTFTGYWTEPSGGVKVIDTDGYLVASVSGYTKSGNKKWDYDEQTLTLYAQWEEKMTTVTINVSPTGAGTLTVGASAFTPGNTTTAGVSTSRTVVATAGNDFTFGSWGVTGNATGTSSTNTYTLKGNGSAGTGTLTANFTLVPCSLMYGNATPLNSPTSTAMSYDATEHAYYKDVTTNSSPYYFRFSHNNSKQYADSWDGEYPNVHSVSGDGTKVNCGEEVQGWENKGSLKYTGASGSPIRIWFDYQNKKAWITETTYSVTVEAGSHGSVSTTSVSGVGATTPSGDITATPDKGYVFTGWTLPSGTSAAAGYTSASNPIRINATAASKTITATFAAATAFVEGRFRVQNAARSSWTTTFSSGDWDENSTRIKFTWDGTNNRYELHTYATPNELSTQISKIDPYFYVKESSSSSSLANVASYWSATAQTLTATGTGNKKSLVSSGTFYNNRLKFNSTDESGYVILYFDEAGVWYELEHTLEYNANGGTGSAPAAKTYYGHGVNATAASNTYTRSGYRFTGWKTAPSSGTSYAANASVPMNSNITLYAQWEESTYSTTVSAGAGGSVSPSGSVNIGEGTGTSITATPNAGYSFSSWTITGGGITPTTSSTSPQTFKATSAGGSITANFTEVLRTVSVVSNNTYLGSVSTASLTDVGPATASAEVTATPTPGATLTNWTLPSGVTAAATYSATSNPISVNATAAGKTITANFTETMHTVTLTNDNSTYGTVNTSSPLSVGQITAVQIQATPKSGYMFSKWVKTSGAGTVTYYTGAGNGQVTDASGDEKETTYICVTGDVTLQATWEPDRSSGYVVHYGNSGKNADGGTDASQTRPWKDGKLYRATTAASDVSYFTFTAGVGDVDKTIYFKIWETSSSAWDHWYGYNSNDGGKITGNVNEATLSTSYGDARLCITMPGNYVFTWNSDDKTLSVAYPTNVYYLRGGFNGWSWAHPMTETSSGVYSATVNMTEANHTYSGANGFKLLIAGQYYGKDGTTVTRSTSTGSAAISPCSTSGANIGLTTDYTGNYTFTYTVASNTLQVTYPTAYKVTYGKGSVDGSASNCSAVDIDNSSAAVTSNSTWVKSGNRVVLTAPAAKEGYTYNGWFDNNAGTGEAITTNANCTITVTSALTRYACYTINNHAITHLDASHGSYTIKVGDASAVSTSTTSDYGKTITLAATPATGYYFGSWSAYKTGTPATTITVTSNHFTMPDYAVTVGATFSPTTYSITYYTNGGSAIPAGSYNIETATFALPTTSEKTGYTFAGWYNNAELEGDAVSSITVGSYGNKEYWAKWTPNTYTVSFNVNGGTASTPDNKNVTFGAAYGELPGGMTHTSKQFIGWYTDSRDGEGDLITAETIVSTASNHTLYAHYENVYSVNVNFKCGEVTLYPSTKVTASASSLTPEITAPEILGYTFSNWTGTNVTPANASSATTTITATASTTITANYTAVPTVYFKNNLGWENVYVTFDAYFGEAGGAIVPGQYGKPYYKMTQLGSTDVYYCVIPDAVNDSWKWNIAFDNKGFTYNEDTHIGSYGYFYQGEFLGRGDFDPKATMFIPYSEDYETRNSGKCYTTGCWMKYNSTDPGYKIYANTYVEGEGSAVAGTPVLLTADVAGGFEFKAKVNFPSADYTYGFMLGKEHEKNTNDLWYSNGGTIWSTTNTLPWDFSAKVDDNAVTSTGKRCGLKTEATGDYTFIVSFATGKPMVNVIYPVSTGDYRLVYKDLATWSNGAHTAAWQHPSRVIKANANAEDIVSFYVSKADGANASIKLHKCTSIDGSGNPVWNAGTAVDLSGITNTGIYNFKVTQDADKNATVTFDGGYTGNFYIRTDASDGGWSNYKTSGKNTMTYSEYAESQTADKRFSHYFMRHVNNGQNIKFCIANDYSECISDTLVDDTYASEWIGNEANIRFMWYHATNKISRAYLSGSTIVSDRFLVLEGDDKMFDANGDALNISGLNANEINFTDDQNWIYEATVKAQPLARIKLTAKFADKIQYFYGAEGDRSGATTDELIGGSGDDKYKMRIVYDFKTNRLMRAFIPDGTITTDLAINADLMIIREHQEDAQQITFSGGSLSEVKTVYGAMKFNKYTVNGKSKESGHAETRASRYERDLFYISFPFDVKLGDAFGFGEYGKHWIIEYYDGKGRAEKGFWADSKPNWKFVMPAERNSFTMKAFEGYILALELDEMAESSSIWDNGVENVYVYFPSDGNVNNISATDRTITIDQKGYECKINRATPEGNRTVKDSYWHCIGVPSFANYSRELSSGGKTIDWSTPNLPYLYEWDWDDNSLSVTTSATFNFKATWSYLVQYAGTSIYWSQVNVTPASIVARERTAPMNAEFRIELQQGGEKADQTFVRLTEEENVTTGFDFNYDLSKEYNKNRANIYTMVTTVKEGDASLTQSAANVLPMSDQTTVVPVGVKIATTGDYTFAIPEGTAGVGVTLIDNETGIRTSLSALDYTINLSAGTYENRFVLEISPIKQMPTDIESVSDQHSAVRKVMIDGILYIVKDGKVFDAHGSRVK